MDSILNTAIATTIITIIKVAARRYVRRWCYGHAPEGHGFGIQERGRSADKTPDKFEELELGFTLSAENMPTVLICYEPAGSGLIYIDTPEVALWLEAIDQEGNVAALNPYNPFTTPVAGYIHIEGLVEHTGNAD